ncbi:MAG: hypothetical protein Q8P95_01300, partial [bacterium]|nr:hypothetical protein [bacterium]
MPACQNPPENSYSCVDKIAEGKRRKRFSFSCVRGFEQLGDECVSSTVDPEKFYAKNINADYSQTIEFTTIDLEWKNLSRAARYTVSWRIIDLATQAERGEGSYSLVRETERIDNKTSYRLTPAQTMAKYNIVVLALTNEGTEVDHFSVDIETDPA